MTVTSCSSSSSTPYLSKETDPFDLMVSEPNFEPYDPDLKLYMYTSKGFTFSCSDLMKRYNPLPTSYSTSLKNHIFVHDFWTPEKTIKGYDRILNSALKAIFPYKTQPLDNRIFFENAGYEAEFQKLTGFALSRENCDTYGYFHLNGHRVFVLGQSHTRKNPHSELSVDIECQQKLHTAALSNKFACFLEGMVRNRQHENLFYNVGCNEAPHLGYRYGIEEENSWTLHGLLLNLYNTKVLNQEADTSLDTEDKQKNCVMSIGNILIHLLTRPHFFSELKKLAQNEKWPKQSSLPKLIMIYVTDFMKKVEEEKAEESMKNFLEKGIVPQDLYRILRAIPALMLHDVDLKVWFDMFQELVWAYSKNFPLLSKDKKWIDETKFDKTHWAHLDRRLTYMRTVHFVNNVWKQRSHLPKNFPIIINIGYNHLDDLVRLLEEKANTLSN